MRKHAALALTRVVGRTGILTEWFVRISVGWEGKWVMAGLGCVGEGGSAQLPAQPNSSLTQAPEWLWDLFFSYLCSRFSTLANDPLAYLKSSSHHVGDPLHVIDLQAFPCPVSVLSRTSQSLQPGFGSSLPCLLGPLHCQWCHLLLVFHLWDGSLIDVEMCSFHPFFLKTASRDSTSFSSCCPSSPSETSLKQPVIFPMFISSPLRHFSTHFSLHLCPLCPSKYLSLRLPVTCIFQNPVYISPRFIWLISCSQHSTAIHFSLF